MSNLSTAQSYPLTVFSQLADVPTYVKTLHQMHLHYPSLVLVPDTFLSLSDASLAASGKRPNTTSLLVQCILEEFDSVPVEPVVRKYWSDTNGTDYSTELTFLVFQLEDYKVLNLSTNCALRMKSALQLLSQYLTSMKIICI